MTGQQDIATMEGHVEITQPVIIRIRQGRRTADVEIGSRADARALIAAVQARMQELPDDDGAGAPDAPAPQAGGTAAGTPVRQIEYCEAADDSVDGEPCARVSGHRPPHRARGGREFGPGARKPARGARARKAAA